LLHHAYASISDIMQLRTFQIIVAQGIVGTMPWNAIAFFTLWLQLLGFSDWHASVLTAAFYGATSAGAFLGGAIGDAAAVSFPSAGRIYTAQTSVRSSCGDAASCGSFCGNAALLWLQELHISDLDWFWMLG
jgi:hypothetical protein